MRNEEFMSRSHTSISEDLIVLVCDREEDAEVPNWKERIRGQVTDVCARLFPARDVL